MIKKIYTTLALMAVIMISNAQTTAMQFSGDDCNGNAVDLFADLDAGKAVLLHFYMPNCSPCPQVAKKIQLMANNILDTYPGMVKGYAFPFKNTTLCSDVASWVSTNGLALYAPMDSGSTQVAYYGGFGMPTVVLLGGSNRDVLFVTQSFSTSDTTIIRDSILNLLNPNHVGIKASNSSISSVDVFPNPASDLVQVQLNVQQSVKLKIDVVNLLGEVISTVYETNNTSSGILKKEIPTTSYSNGIYLIRVSADNKVQNYKFTVNH